MTDPGSAIATAPPMIGRISVTDKAGADPRQVTGWGCVTSGAPVPVSFPFLALPPEKAARSECMCVLWTGARDGFIFSGTVGRDRVVVFLWKEICEW